MPKRNRQPAEKVEVKEPPLPPPGLLMPVLFALLAAAGFWTVLGVFRIFCFVSTDSFWLIETGRQILSKANLPAGDIFSFTNNGTPWIIYQWLFEVVSGLLDRLGGLRLIQSFVLATAALLFGVLAVRGMSRNGVSFFMSSFVCLTAMLASITFVNLRPQLLSMVFIYLVQRALDSHWQRPSYKLLLLVPVFLVWGNCHIMFAIGLLVVFIYWMFSIGSWLVRRKAEGGELRSTRARFLGGTFLLALWAALLNPYGSKVVEYGVMVSNESFWTRQIGEVMMPEFSDPLMVWILSYVMLAVLSFMVSTRRPSAPEAWTFITLLGMGLMSYKCLPFFIAATMHGTALRLQPAWTELVGGRIKVSPRLKSVSGRLTAWSLHPVYAVVVLLLAAVHGLAYSPLFPPWVPINAAGTLEPDPPGKRLFCSAKFGSYLIYRFHGQVPVFIDTRFDMYGPEFSGHYFAAHQRGIGWRELFEKYKVDGAFVEAGSTIAAILANSPQWKELYRDSQAAVFVPAAAGTPPAQEKPIN